MVDFTRLTQEVILEILLHLHPNDIHTLAATCKSLHLSLTLRSLSFPFAKKHLKLVARRTLGKYSEPWDSEWLHDLNSKAPVRYREPLLFNYGLAAVALNGFSFALETHLGELILGHYGVTCTADIEFSDAAARRERNYWVSLVETARGLGLIGLENLPLPSLLKSDSFLEQQIRDAFTFLALSQSMDLSRDLVSKYTVKPFINPFALNQSFGVAATYKSLEMVQLMLAVLSNESLDSITEPFMQTLTTACIQHDFRELIELLPVGHSAFHSGGASMSKLAVECNRKEVLELLLQKGAVLPRDALCHAAYPRYDKEPERLLEMVRYLLAVGTDPNTTADSYTPLHKAAFYGAENVVPLLIDAGAEIDAVNKFERTPLHVACSYGQAGLAGLLVNAGANVESVDEIGRKPLHLAANGDHAECVKILLYAGVNVDAVDADGRTALHIACNENRPSIAKLLLNAGANVDEVDEHDWTPLHCASRHDRVEVAKVLLDARANIEAEDQKCRTPLLLACEWNHVRVAKLLLDAGANTEADDQASGSTPLMYACCLNRVELATALLDAGANVEVASQAGESLLHFAVTAAAVNEEDEDGVNERSHRHDLRMLKLILERAPALVLRRDDEGKTPLDLAMEECDECENTWVGEEGIQLLRDVEARLSNTKGESES
ncbi:hypothetical protein HDU96_006885 [Phlyctochytrium bullatum]|nr:hypothetical protein HDU96_006885 [Phlyctochytrium bullatum]